MGVIGSLRLPVVYRYRACDDGDMNGFPPSRFAFVLAAASIVLLVSGCAGPGSADPGLSPTPSVSVSPTATTAPTPAVPTLAVPAFAGDCGLMASASDLSVSVERTLADPENCTSPGVRTLGGTSCVWRANDFLGVRAHALPTAIVPQDVQDSYATPTCGSYTSDGYGCGVAVSKRGIWILVSVDSYLIDGSPATDEVLRRQLAAATPVFESAMSDATTPTPVAAVPDDAWWSPITCEQLASGIDLTGILGSDDVQSGYPSGLAATFPETLAEERGTSISCAWNAASGSAIIVHASPGGAGGWQMIQDEWSARSPLTAITIPGAEEAFRAQAGLRPESTSVIATDGTNVLQVMEAPDPEAAAGQIIAAFPRD